MPRRSEAGSDHVSTSDRGLRPVPPPLERIRRQIHPPRLPPREQTIPGDRHTLHEQLTGRGERALHAIAVLTHQRHRDRISGVRLRQTGHHPIRTHIHERVHTLAGQPPHTVGEPHRRPHLPRPIPRA
ncbi:hypothetical protein, partial [Streptantibioticus ferralitis]